MYKRDLSKPLAPTYGDPPKKVKAPNISSGPDTTFTASSSDQNIAKRKVESKVRVYGKIPKGVKYTRNSKTGKYTAYSTVKKK
jgi:hypothetical protein